MQSRGNRAQTFTVVDVSHARLSPFTPLRTPSTQARMLAERYIYAFECRKVIGFSFNTLRDWLKRFAPLFHPIRSKTKTNCVIASRALRQLHVITSSFDWFTVLSVFFVIG